MARKISLKESVGCHYHIDLAIGAPQVGAAVLISTAYQRLGVVGH
jgi:hypothetical protein